MDAIQSLKNDHRTVEELLTRFEKLGKRAKKNKGTIAMKICDELTLHSEIEETVFYPACREADPDVTEEILEDLTWFSTIDVGPWVHAIMGLDPKSSAAAPAPSASAVPSTQTSRSRRRKRRPSTNASRKTASRRTC